MIHIHITCAATEYPLAEVIAADLQQRGAQVSISQPTEGLAVTRAGPIEQCHDLVLLFSPQAMPSAWVQAEIAWALQAGKNVIPVFVEPTSLLDFLFLVGQPQVALYGQPFGQALSALAALLRLDQTQGTGVQSTPAPLAETAAEPPLASLFDETELETLFFAAAELTLSQPERAIFLYQIVLNAAPDYAGGSVHGLIERESNRKKPIWLLRLAEAADEAISKQDWQRVQRLVLDMAALEPSSPFIVKVRARIAAVRLSDFYAQVALAINAEKWDDVEHVIGEVKTTIVDAEIVEEFTAKTRQKQLEYLLEASNQALRKKQWAAAQDYAERIKALAPNSPHPQKIVAQLEEGILSDLINRANQAVSDGNWTDAEKLKRAILERAPNHPIAGFLGQQIRTTRAVQLIREATQYVDQKNLGALLAVIEALQALDPSHPELTHLHTLAAQLKSRVAQEAECSALYEQAQHAQAAGRMGAVMTFLRHINETCPDFGDPQGLAGDEIHAETAVLVREVRQIAMTKETTTGVAFSPDGAVLAAASHYAGATLWDMAAGAVSLTLDTFISGVVVFSPDGTLIATAGGASYISLWDHYGKLLRQISAGPSHTTVFGLAFSPGSTALAAALSDGRVKLFTVDDGKLIATFAGHQPHVAYCVAFSPDGSQIVSGGGDNNVRVYQTSDLRKSKSETLSWLPRLKPAEEIWANAVDTVSSSVYSLAYSPRGDLLVIGGANGRILVRDVADEKYVTLPSISAHDGAVNSLAFSPDGTLLVSGSSDRTVKLWDVRGDQPEDEALAVLRGHVADVKSVAFSPDSRFIASAGGDQSVRLWGLGRPFVEKSKR